MHYLISLGETMAMTYVVVYFVVGPLLVAVAIMVIAAARAVAAVLPGLLLIGGAIVAALTLTPGQVAFAIAFAIAMFLLLFAEVTALGICMILALRCAAPVIDSLRHWRTRAFAGRAVARELITPPVLIDPPVKLHPDPEIETLKRKLKLEFEKAEPPWLGC